jgi:hypothetical protein
VRSGSPSRAQADYRLLLASVFDFMRKSGFAESEVKQTCEEALTQHWSKPNRSNAAGSATTLAVAALALDAWHRNRRYMVGSQPRAVPLRGPAPSVEALIRSQGNSGNAHVLARHLKSLGLIIRTSGNLYKPSDRMALVRGFDPVIQQYVARSSSTLLATIRHNTSRSGHSSPLIERFAEVPDLPQAHVAEFRRFARIQGWAFLRTVNDWLESRRARTSAARAGRTVRAGVHLYSYVQQTSERR